MQGEQRERLMALAAQVAAENDPAKFHSLLLELNHLLEQQALPIPPSQKPRPDPQPTERL